MATRSTAARLRRTFQYNNDNADSDSDSQPEAMDEQEQESFIQSLQDRNNTQNAHITTLLLALPLLACIAYLPSLPSLPALLAISSLASTAWLLRRFPPAVTGVHPLDVWAGTGGLVSRSPLDASLPYLNLLLALLLAFWGGAVAYKARNYGGEERTGSAALGWPLLCNVPLGVYAVVLALKMVMASVDPERELSGLRYEYKGA